MDNETVVRRIHDEPIQVLASTMLKLQILGRRLEDEELKQLALGAEDAVEQALKSLRELMADLGADTSTS